jgi:predicted PurR-regulated permease PerM
MLRRATHLVARAREHIRTAAERDPHAWPERDADRAILVHDDELTTTSGGAHTDGAHTDDADGADAEEPLGSPAAGAPDLDGPLGPGGVSGPPEGGRPHRPSERGRRLLGPGRDAPHGDAAVPSGLRTAAAWSWRGIVVLAGLYVLLYAAAYVAVVLVPVFVALLLAALLQPGAAALIRHGWPRSLAAFLMLLVGLAVVAGIITLVVQQVTAGFTDLADQVTQGLDQIRDFVVETFPVTQRQIDEALTSFQDFVAGNQEELASGAITTATTVGEVFTGVVLALFTLFFFLKDGRSIWLWLVGLFPRDARAYVDEAARRSWRTLISYVRATVAVALVDAVGIGTGLAILGVPLVIPLAVLTFFGGFVPIIGAFVAGAFAVLVALVSNGFTTALIVLGIVLLVQQIEGNVLQPIIQGRGFNLHAAVVILAVTAGSSLAGIIGAFLSVPIAAIIAVVYRYVRDELDERSPEIAADGTEARLDGDRTGAELTREQVAPPGDRSAAVASDGDPPR